MKILFFFKGGNLSCFVVVEKCQQDGEVVVYADL
jgi:hypothetical protein